MASVLDALRATTDEPPELLKRPADEPPPPPKRTVADVVNAHQAAQDTPPPPPDQKPGVAGGTSVGDLFRRDKERAATPELLRRPEEPVAYKPSTDEPPELLKRPEGLYPGDPGVPTRLERYALTAARIGVPTVAGIAAGALSGPGAPVVGPLVGASAATANELLLEKYEKERGFRKDVSPYGVMWQGVLGGFPGIPLSPELSIPLRYGARAAEGTGIGALATTGQTLAEEKRLPTKEELATGAATGAVFGTGGAALEAHGIPYLRRRAERNALATSVDQLTGEITAAPADAPKMVTQPGETIGPGSEPVAGAHPSEFVGPPEPPPGSLAAVQAAAAAPSRTGEFVGPPAPEQSESARLQAAREWAQRSRIIPKDATDVRFSEDRVGWMNAEGRPEWRTYPRAVFEAPVEIAPEQALPPPPPGAEPLPRLGLPEPPGAEPPPPSGEAPPPGGPPGEPPPGGPFAGGPGEGEPETPWGRRPTFRRYPGAGEAITGDEIAAQRSADPERVTRAIDSIDREFGDVLDDESRTRLKQQIVDNQGRFEYLGRGAQTMERTRGLGRDYVVDLDAAKLEPKGTTWNAEQTQAMKNHIVGLDQSIQDAQTAYDASPTPEHGLVLQKAVQDQIDAFNIFRARGAEAGRTVNIYKGTAEDIASGNQRLMMAALRRGVPPDKLADIIRQTGPKDVQARAEMLMQFADRGPWHKRLRDTMQTIFISNILSGPPPHERNILGNAVNALLNPVAAKPFSALDEALIRRLPPEERTVYLGEIGKHFVGMWDAVPDAVQKATEIFKRGYTGEQASTYDLPYKELGIGRHPALRAALNIVPRALGGMDQFFRVLGQESSLNSQAYVKARSQALLENAAGHLPQGTSFADRLDQLYQYHREHITPEMMSQTADEAARGVYQEKDFIAREMTRIRDWIPGGGFLMPFVTTQTNITKQGLHYTPAGFFMPSTRGKGGVTPRMASLHRGEALSGTVGMLLSPLALMAMGGKLHGSGPDDPKANDEWRQTHVPNSIELGGHMVGFNQLGPLAIPLAAIGNAWDKYDEIKQRDGDVSANAAMSEIFPATVGGTAQSVLDQPYLQGISNLVDVARHPKEGRYWSKLFKDIGAGFIPGSGMLRYIEQIQDPTIRQGKTFGQKLEAGIPGGIIPGVSSQNVPPKLDVFGEPVTIQKEGGAWGRATIPIDVERTQSDPLREELARQGLTLSPPSSITVGPHDQPLAPEEDLAIKQAKGKQLRAQLEEVFASDAYQSADPETQKRMLKSMMGRTRTAISARAKAMREQEGMVAEEALRW